MISFFLMCSPKTAEKNIGGNLETKTHHSFDVVSFVRFGVIFGICVHMRSTESTFRFERCKCSTKNRQIFAGCPSIKQRREDKKPDSLNRNKKVICERQAINDKLTDFILACVRIPIHVDGIAVAVACVTRTSRRGSEEQSKINYVCWRCLFRFHWCSNATDYFHNADGHRDR